MGIIMHEISVCFEVVKSVEKIVEENNLTKIETIVLEIGELSSIVPKYMDECFIVAVEGTMFENTKLEIEVIAGIGKCGSCGQVYHLLKNNGYCPECKDKNFEVVSGREFNIKEIVAC